MKDRQQLAEAFLQEAVFVSRGTQAARHALASAPRTAPSEERPTDQGGAGAVAPGQCGLGERAAVVLDLSERGRELFEALFPTEAAAELDEARLGRMRQTMRQWITRQDALDRKRNHFLKDFRRTHGFDRTAYSAELLAEYEQGLESINGENRDRLAEAARELLGH
jgi:hypothetical protein